MTYEGLTKREAIAALRAKAEELGDLAEEHERIRRLHEIATGRNVALAAVIACVQNAVERSDREMWVPQSFKAAVREAVEPVDTDRPLRQTRARVLFDVAEELEDRGVPGVAVGSAWLRKRATGILVGLGR